MDDMSESPPIEPVDPVPGEPAPDQAGPEFAPVRAGAAAVSRALLGVADAFGPSGRARTTIDVGHGMLAVAADAAGRLVTTAREFAAPVERAVGRALGPAVGSAITPIRHEVEPRLRAAITGLAERGRTERGRGEADLDRILDAIVPRVTAAVLDRIDLTAVVTDRVDVNAIADQVDTGAIAARIDVDAIAARVDVEAVLERVDLAALTEDVLEAIDLPGIIRQSTGSMATETVMDVRMQGIGADQAVNRFVDRVLRRSRRDTQAGTDGSAEPTGDGNANGDGA